MYNAILGIAELKSSNNQYLNNNKLKTMWIWKGPFLVWTYRQLPPESAAPLGFTKLYGDFQLICLAAARTDTVGTEVAGEYSGAFSTASISPRSRSEARSRCLLVQRRHRGSIVELWSDVSRKYSMGVVYHDGLYQSRQQCLSASCLLIGFENNGSPSSPAAD